MQITTGKGTLATKDIPEIINDVTDDILKEFLTYTDCNRNYRIVPQELQFYRKFTIPVPHKCFFCRYRDRSQQFKNPYTLWHRKCGCAGAQSSNGTYENTIEHFHGTGACPNEFETSYAPERPEIVYCEQCYQAEVS